MDTITGSSWENDDGTISIVKTEIEDYDPADEHNTENVDDENYINQYEEEGNATNELFIPKQEHLEPQGNYAEGGMDGFQNECIENNFQDTSSAVGDAENWPLIQGYTIPETEEHFMNQPGTSDISVFAYKREAELYPCNYCDYVGAHPKLLTSHMNNRHIKSVVYQCPHCPYNSTISRNTRDHIQCKHCNEDDDKPIIKRKCEFCDYCASSATALKNHMNKHTKEVKHQCSFCEFNTLWEGYLKMHIRRKHSDQSMDSGSAKEYPCQYCDYKAATPSTLKLHTNKHTREQEHQCPYCPYKTVWTTYIKLHIQNKHFKGEKSPPSKEHPCSFCDYKAKNSTLLRQHMNKHTREKVHQCPHCPFNTLWVTYMKLHIKRKHTENNESESTEKKDFQCQYCTYKAISLSHLKIHENKHTKAIEYKCNQCDFKTTWYGYLKFHIKRKHSAKSDVKEEEAKSTFPCSFCPYKAINLSTLKVHQNKHTRENIYNCPHCEFKTTWRAYIKSHIQRHNADNFKTRKQGVAAVKSFPCQYCSYVATQMGSLKLHVNSKHTRENMHKCPECDYECAVYGNLKMHVRRKHGLKPDENGKYHCKECDFVSETASEIKIHLNEKHDLKIEVDDIKKEDEKVYSCQYCSYTTLYQQVMKKHINKHTRQNVIKCPHCPYSTVWNHYMKVHIKRHNEPKTLTGRQRSTKPNTDQSRLFPCQYCDHRSLSFSSLRDHINSVHTREIIHKCPYCDHKCTLKGNLKGHIRRKHPAEFIEQEKRYQCEHCDFKTSERRNLKIHLKKEHNIDDAKVKAENGEYKCQFCEYKARSLYTLKIHRHKHTKENAYRCPQCEFATKWPNYLRKHIKQHSIGKSRVSCLYCDYKGCSTFRLRKHIESLHKTDDYYPCPKPNCLFKTIHYTSLRMHLKGSIHASGVPRSHMSVSRNFSYKYRPNEGRYFACDYCDYASKTQGNLDKHIENKHEKKGMKCGLCSYRTPSKNYLSRHYKLRHSNVKTEDSETIKTEQEINEDENKTLENNSDNQDENIPKLDAPELDNKSEIFFTDQNETTANASNNECEEVPGVLNRSRRKRSFIPYYVEDSDEEENEFICEDFLEVELGANTGTNDKQSDVELNKNEDLTSDITESTTFDSTMDCAQDAGVNEIENIETKAQDVQETILIADDVSSEQTSTGKVESVNKINGFSGRSKTSNSNIQSRVITRGRKRINGKRRVAIKKVIVKGNTKENMLDTKVNHKVETVNNPSPNVEEDPVVEGIETTGMRVTCDEDQSNQIDNESHNVPSKESTTTEDLPVGETVTSKNNPDDRKPCNEDDINQTEVKSCSKSIKESLTRNSDEKD
ncbi:zinc finger protein 26-like [Coccinella septempunctata]|uniref:zinc finger protein 26-like n=1 Tax=Coccinella septempunctata TaxID=41139 RepID=UPI001D07E2B3|nr:zinc finger protein 26-like [Coccinella septempunctata]